MNLFPFLIFVGILILYSYEYEIIEMSSYERKTVQYTDKRTFFIFKYNHTFTRLDNSTTSHLTIRVFPANTYFYFYIYKEEKDIQEENGNFKNYINDAKYTKITTGHMNIGVTYSHVFYIAIKYTYISYQPYAFDATFGFYSSNSLTEVKKVFYHDYLYSQTLNYSFFISENHSKYVRIGSKGWTSSSTTYLEVLECDSNNTKNVTFKKQSTYFEDFIKLKQNHSYYFNFRLLRSLYTFTDERIYLYLMQTNYSGIIHVEKNKEEFEIFPIIGGLNLSLDISSIREGYKLVFEYNKDWSSNLYKVFKAYGYNTNDTNNINNSTYVMPLVVTDDFKYKDYCKGDICKNGIIRNNSNINTVLFTIPKSQNYVKFIKFRYGKEEFVPPTHVVFTCLLSLLIASPNIIMYIVRKKKKRMTASITTLIMNLILNFGYGNFLGEFIGLGGYDSFMLGQSLLTIYVIACFAFLIMQCCCKKRGYFDVIYNLCNKLDDSRSFHELVSYNRKLPPILFVGAYAQHQESREVWKEYEKVKRKVYRYETSYYSDGSSYTHKYFDHYETDYEYRTTHYSDWGRVDQGGGRFYSCPGSHSSRYDKDVEYRTVETWRREKEYKYKSWQDETRSITNLVYCTIVEATFSPHIIFDKESKDIMNLMKDDLYKEGKRHDTDVYTYDNFTYPQFITKHTCSLNDEEYQRIKNKFSRKRWYFTWIILFILGYSSLLESYARYEIGKVPIVITKSVSSVLNKRANYNTYDDYPPQIVFSYSLTKIQTNRIQRKIKKGEADITELENPLVVIN